MNDISGIDWIGMSDDQIVGQVGQFVKYHRIEQNKRQTVLSKEAGISRSTLSLLERGGAVTITTLIQVLRVLDQLHVINGFAINRQQSPLLLAKAERKNRQRVVLPRKKKKMSVENEDVNW